MTPARSGLTREQEIWGMALWVETHHGSGGAAHIAEQIERLIMAGEPDGVALWRAVAQHYRALAGPAGGAQ